MCGGGGKKMHMCVCICMDVGGRKRGGKCGVYG